MAVQYFALHWFKCEYVSVGNANMECILVLQEKCAQYWPSDGSVVHGDISIEIKREEENESYTVRELLVTNNRVRKRPHPASPPSRFLFHSTF